MEIVTTSKGEKTTHELPEQRLNLVVHQQGIRVDMPTADVHLDAVKTVNFIQGLTQREWEHYSTGPLFHFLFGRVFPPDVSNFSAVEVPKTVEELKEGDYGVQHVCGLIIMLGNAVFSAQDQNKPLRVFIREIETHLHPATQQRIMDVLRFFLGDLEIKSEENAGG